VPVQDFSPQYKKISRDMNCFCHNVDWYRSSTVSVGPCTVQKEIVQVNT
jgi:hypothetical protein